MSTIGHMPAVRDRSVSTRVDAEFAGWLDATAHADRRSRSNLLWALLEAISPPTKIKLAIPIITRKGIIMPNYELRDDTVATVPMAITTGRTNAMVSFL